MQSTICLPAALRSAGHGLLDRLSSSLHTKLPACPISSIASSRRRKSHFLSFLSSGPRTFPRVFASSLTGPSDAAQVRATSEEGEGVLIDYDNLPPEARPRMPLVPEDRPKPTTAVAVVEAYLDKLWRDFFSNPHNWFDNRLKRRAPKYADFKNKITKEGLWITAKWNPPWVRTELSLMSNFRAVPYDDRLWAEKKAKEEEERREKPPPVAPGAWLKDELKAKKDRAAGIGSSGVDTWHRSDNTVNPPPPVSAPAAAGQEQL